MGMAGIGRGMVVPGGNAAGRHPVSEAALRGKRESGGRRRAKPVRFRLEIGFLQTGQGVAAISMAVRRAWRLTRVGLWSLRVRAGWAGASCEQVRVHDVELAMGVGLAGDLAFCAFVVALSYFDRLAAGVEGQFDRSGSDHVAGDGLG